MPTSRQLSYINKSYQKYLAKVEEYERSGRGLKVQGRSSPDIYAERYIIRKGRGLRVTELPEIVASEGLTFTIDEASRIANDIIASGRDPKLFMFDVEGLYTDNGDVDYASLLQKILAMDGATAFDFVSSLIDQGIYADHDDFQEAVY